MSSQNIVPTMSDEDANDVIRAFSVDDEWPEDGVSEDLMEYVRWGLAIGIRFTEALYAKSCSIPADKVVVDREERIQELQLLLNVLQHDEPQKGHDGGCHPDAGCDGDCANYYYHWQEVRKAEAKLDVLRAQAKEGGEG